MLEAHIYIVVGSVGPLIIVRIPNEQLNWRKQIVPALTTIMKSHGLRRKDISFTERQGPAAEREPHLSDWEKYRGRLELAYTGNVEVLPSFNFYDWKDGEFVLIRASQKN